MLETAGVLVTLIVIAALFLSLAEQWQEEEEDGPSERAEEWQEELNGGWEKSPTRLSDADFSRPARTRKHHNNGSLRYTWFGRPRRPCV